MVLLLTILLYKSRKQKHRIGTLRDGTQIDTFLSSDCQKPDMEKEVCGLLGSFVGEGVEERGDDWLDLVVRCATEGTCSTVVAMFVRDSTPQTRSLLCTTTCSRNHTHKETHFIIWMIQKNTHFYKYCCLTHTHKKEVLLSHSYIASPLFSLNNSCVLVCVFFFFLSVEQNVY